MMITVPQMPAPVPSAQVLPTYQGRLSYTCLSTWEKDPTEWVLKYLVGAPRLPQTQPMSVGSAFDAFVKSYLYREIFGHTDGGYDASSLFEAQVEPQNRDWARVAGMHVFLQYRDAGCAKRLLDMMEQSSSAPVFERKLQASLPIDRYVPGAEQVPATGFPDLRFHTRSGVPVIVDWKVNGYCGKTATSPSPGYVQCVDGPQWVARASRPVHPKAAVSYLDGIAYSDGPFDHKWKDQLTMYNWMLPQAPSVPVAQAQEALLIIEQCASGAGTECPPFRFARHSCLSTLDYQTTLAKRIAHMWKHVSDGYAFPLLTRAESDAKVRQLIASYGSDDGTFTALTRSSRNW